MGYISGLYTGLKFVSALVDNAEQVSALDTYLQGLVDANLSDSVVCLYMIPTDFSSTTESLTPVYTETITRSTKLDGYVPRNKKLLTYPYCFLTVDTLSESHNYRFEFSDADDKSISFNLSAGQPINPEIIVVPIDYNSPSAVGDVSESITVQGFPQCAFSIDSFRAWVAGGGLAQSLISLAGGNIYGALTASNTSVDSKGRETYTGGAYSAGVGLATSAASLASQAISLATSGSKARGTQGSATLVANRAMGVYYRRMSVTAQYAKMIDDYFDRYGYSCERLKVPNTHSRPHWNYVKTRGCSLTGHLPADDLRRLEQIYDNGITFWKNGGEVGNYSLDNSPS